MSTKTLFGGYFQHFLGQSLANEIFLKKSSSTHFLTFAKPLFHAKHDKTEKIKVGLSPSKKNLFFYFIKSPLKMMKNAFYFVLKDLLVLKILKFLS